ncbi:amidohydrolase family protein [Salipaludibacillus aurantiacus]|uniref:Predicted metal-dependent hydrolase, TIM-barrel fold n=1 Tax=Salipaludibacillus aurantiacus TaxID=1601833 RepID=A0A1H9VZS2_9BACI|nr:amidohydrolase family protein [Salipaludibacillus aurantiacus]SES27029.1 Predicted metal-dependent hydrolase, TIM-barrel fold [Salipaludibacillus aurantiacus]
MTVFDAHLHIIDQRFPLIPNEGYVPDYFACDDYLQKTGPLNVMGGAVVSGSFQGFDQSYLINALKTLGENFFGVTQLPSGTPDEEIMRLNDAGIRAVRFNVNRGGSEDISRLDYVAKRVYDLCNWHTELYINSIHLPEIRPVIENLPAVSIDHLGLSKEGFDTLLSLVDKGVKVKATGFGRIDIDPGRAIKRIYSVNPDALMFGTDLPSTRADRPFRLSDVEIVIEVLGEEEAEKVLYKNALNWYRK